MNGADPITLGDVRYWRERALKAEHDVAALRSALSSAHARIDALTARVLRLTTLSKIEGGK